MDFLGDYWTYHQCYEVPQNYAFWSAIATLGATIHRKLYFLHGDIEIHANMYVLLVGPMGNGKSTCCDFACDLFRAACPELEIGASTQSAEAIVKEMSREGFERAFTNELGESVQVRPYAFFINEFKDFIAYNPVRMLNFLVNIYDRKVFKAETIIRGAENIINPSINILGCENPDQLAKFMKNDVMTGGMSRRTILVYETQYSEPKAFINVEGSPREAWNRVKQRLIDVRKVVGRFQWAESGKKFYEPWYNEKQRSLASINNPLMQGYTSTKHIQLFKVCMLLDAVSDKPMFLFTDELLQFGLALLDVLEANMPKLSIAAGRNELIGPQQKILELLKAGGKFGPGWLPEKDIRRLIETELNSAETFGVLRHLEDTEQVIKKEFLVKNQDGAEVARVMYLLPEKLAELRKRKSNQT